MIDHWPEFIKLIRADIISSIDAEACMRKYFVAPSVDRGLCGLMISGMMANKFISRPNHAVNQCELNIVNIDPEISVIIISSDASGLISTGRIKTNIFGVWAR